MLALALAALIMMAIGMALDLHLRTLNQYRGQLEEAQLARAVLRHIANDLRGAVRYEPPDLSGAKEFAAGAGGAAVESADDLGNAFGGSETTANDLLGGLGLGSAEEAAGSVTDIAGTTASPPIPGIYGNLTELQIDVSRLPRIDQYGVNTAGGGLMPASIPSDIKTIAYYVQTSSMLDAGAPMYSSTTPITGNSNAGLVRRELDRAVALYAAQNGGATQDLAVGELMAPEIAGVQFQYYDGATVYEEWDSELNGGLPSAVEVTLLINRQPQQPGLLDGLPLVSMLTAGEQEQANVGVYRLFVHLPMGGTSSSGGSAALDEETTGEESATSQSSTTNGSGGLAP